MERLEPIPSPAWHALREFCHRALPFVVFAAAALVTGTLWNQRFAGPLFVGEVEPVATHVTTLEGGTPDDLHGERLQTVTNNQVIGVIHMLEP